MKIQPKSESLRRQSSDLTLNRSLDQTELESSTPTAWPEGFTFGKYRVIRPIGGGAAGLVYLVEDTQLGRKIAIKVSRTLAEQSERATQRFLREAKVVAGLQHPNICQVYEYGRHEGHLFIAMSYVEGRAMSEWLETESPGELEVARIIRTLALALHETHQHGVIHRDLKPANILMSNGDVPVLTDFGLALTNSSHLSARLTQPGLIVGSPAYMSPEQIRNASDVSSSTDVYSLGVVMYQMLCGTLPHSGEILTVIRKIALDDPKPPSFHRPGISAAMNAICLKAIEKEPHQRFASMSEFATVLSEAIESGSLSSDIGSTVAPARVRKSNVSRWVVAIGIFAVLGMLLVASRFLKTSNEILPGDDGLPVAVASKGDADSTDAAQLALRLARLNELIREGVRIETDSGIIDSPVTEFPSSAYAVTTVEYEGFDFEELRDIFDVVPHFQRLNVCTSDFIPEAWEFLVQHCPPELHIETDELTSMELAAIGRLDQVTYLDLDCPTLVDSDLEVIEGLTNLRVLVLSGNKIQGSCFRYFTRLNLHELDLSDTQIRDRFLSELEHIPRVGMLRLAGTPITGDGLASLANLSRLRDLDVSFTSTNNDHLRSLKKTKLQGLYLEGCHRVTDLSPLANLPIEQLEIRGTSVTDLRWLTKLPLVDVGVDLRSERDRALLLSIPTLETVNGVPVEVELEADDED